MHPAINHLYLLGYLLGIGISGITFSTSVQAQIPPSNQPPVSNYSLSAE